MHGLKINIIKACFYNGNVHLPTGSEVEHPVDQPLGLVQHDLSSSSGLPVS